MESQSLLSASSRFVAQLSVLQGGNNNTYCHDSPLNWMDWGACAEDKSGFARFVRHLIAFRCCFAAPLLVGVLTYCVAIPLFVRVLRSHPPSDFCMSAGCCRSSSAPCLSLAPVPCRRNGKEPDTSVCCIAERA